MNPIKTTFDNAATNAATDEKRGHKHGFLAVDIFVAVLAITEFR
jgi:hypothetical protein